MEAHGLSRHQVPYLALCLLICGGGAPWHLFMGGLSSCHAQEIHHPGFELATIDAETRWAFRVLSPVTIGSTIIRLGDVIKPLDPNMAGWQRLRRSPIGLMPAGVDSITIERKRLAKVIYNAEATPLAIDWVGPTKIKVHYQADKTAVTPSYTQISDHAPSVEQAAYVDDPAPPANTLSPYEIKRIVLWIRLALDREHPAIAEAYGIEIDGRQPGLERLRSATGVISIATTGAVAEGHCRFHVVARSVNGPLETDVRVKLNAHPVVVAARRSFPRGYRIESSDLILEPVPEDELEPDFVSDPSELIGLEVRGVVRANRPIMRGDLGAPTLVHRGDLIEVRVVAGGITVTTNAKAMGNGAESDRIEIETLQPRKRTVARVVQPGVVEIITRAPKVNP